MQKNKDKKNKKNKDLNKKKNKDYKKNKDKKNKKNKDYKKKKKKIKTQYLRILFSLFKCSKLKMLNYQLFIDFKD